MNKLAVRTETNPNRARSQKRAQTGQTAVEFAIALPVLLVLLTAIVSLGVAFNHELQLTYATNNATQLLSMSRGQTTDPCQTASQAVYSSAPTLAQSNVKFTIVLAGTTVASGAAQPSCGGSQTNLVQNQNAQVTTTYPCNLQIFGFNPAPSCNLTAQTTVMIQ